jgi:hypothetical protein
MTDEELYFREWLVRIVDNTIPTLYDAWKADRKVAPFAVTWSDGPVKCHDGTLVYGPCHCDLPEKKEEEWPKLLRQMVEISDPIAILFAEQRDKDVLLILESKYGTQSWSLPIQRRGDVRILGKPIKRRDEDKLGLLYKKTLN